MTHEWKMKDHGGDIYHWTSPIPTVPPGNYQHGQYVVERDGVITIEPWQAARRQLSVLAGPFETLDQAKVAYLMLRDALTY